MQALISSIEPVETGYRVAQVVGDVNTFPVAAELFWVSCADDVIADQFWYDPSDATIKQIPAAQVSTPSDSQPTVTGAQTL